MEFILLHGSHVLELPGSRGVIARMESNARYGTTPGSIITSIINFTVIAKP